MPMLKPHPEWGMNPTHIGCYVCATRFDEVFLFGDSINFKAPPLTLFKPDSPQFRVCPACTECCEKGVVFVLVEREKDEFGEYARHGAYVAISEEQLREMYNGNNKLADESLKTRVKLIFQEDWEKLGFPAPETTKG